MAITFNLFKLSAIAVFLGSALMGTLASAAEPYPNKPVRLIVPFAPGGGSDVVARVIADKLAADWKQPIIVENRPGAGGALGAGLVASAAPDGYTLLLSDASATTINPTLYPKLTYAAKDLTPVVNVATFTLVLIVPTNSPIKSVADLVAQDKSRSEGFNAASSGPGSSPHLMLELMNSLAGTKLVHIPYRGGGPAMIDVVSGQVDLMFNGLSDNTASLIRAHKLKALAVTTSKRIASMPDIPTMAESGFPSVDVVSAQTLFVPAGTSPAIIDKINSDIANVMKLPDVVQRWTQSGYLPFQKQSPAEVAAWFDRETEKWGKLIRARGITVD